MQNVHLLLSQTHCASNELKLSFLFLPCSSGVFCFSKCHHTLIILPSSSSSMLSSSLFSLFFSLTLDLGELWAQVSAAAKKALALLGLCISPPRISSWTWWEPNSHHLSQGRCYLASLRRVSCFSQPPESAVALCETGCLLLDLKWSLAEQSWDTCVNWLWFPQSRLGQDCSKNYIPKHISDVCFEIQIQAQTLPKLRKLMLGIWSSSSTKR